jgi:hypothetical protein
MEMLCMCDVIADITSFRPSVDSFAHRHEFAFKPAQLETRRMKYLPIHATSIIDNRSSIDGRPSLQQLQQQLSIILIQAENAK